MLLIEVDTNNIANNYYFVDTCNGYTLCCDVYGLAPDRYKTDGLTNRSLYT